MEKALFNNRAPIYLDPTPANAGHDARAARDYRHWLRGFLNSPRPLDNAARWRTASMKTAFSTYRPGRYSEILDGVSQGKVLWLKTLHAAPEWEVQAIQEYSPLGIGVYCKECGWEGTEFEVIQAAPTVACCPNCEMHLS